MSAPLTPGSTLAVPVNRGRESALGVLLRSIGDADVAGPWYPRAIVLVTSDLPGLASIAHRAVPRLAIPLSVVYVPSAVTVGALRNRAAAAVTTTWIHFMDSDTEAPRDYFTRLRDATAGDATTECFQLWFRPGDGASRWARFEAEMDQDTCAAYQSDAGVCGLNGMNFLIRTERLRAEPFREDLLAAEDVELGFRLYVRRIAVRLLPGVSAVHHYPNRLTRLLQRKFWHGRGYARAWPHVTGILDQLPTTAAALASRPRRSAMFRGYYKLAVKIVVIGMAMEQWRDRARKLALAGPFAGVRNH